MGIRTFFRMHVKYRRFDELPPATRDMIMLESIRTGEFDLFRERDRRWSIDYSNRNPGWSPASEKRSCSEMGRNTNADNRR